MDAWSCASGQNGSVPFSLVSSFELRTSALSRGMKIHKIWLLILDFIRQNREFLSWRGLSLT